MYVKSHTLRMLTVVFLVCVGGEIKNIGDDDHDYDYYNDDYYFDDYDYGRNNHTGIKPIQTDDNFIVEMCQSDNNYNDIESKQNDPFFDSCTCGHACSWPKRYCECDDICDVFNDCCNDANASIANEKFLKLKEVFPNVRCAYERQIHRSWYIFVVKKCPMDADQEAKDLCENIDTDNIISTTPVVGQYTELPYMNLYCAICNNESYTPLKPELYCAWADPYEGNYTMDELLKLDACFISFVAEEKHVFTFEVVRECYPAISQCTNTTADDSQKLQCESGKKEYVFTNYNIYANKDCFFCSDESGENVSCIMNDIYNISWMSSGSKALYSYRMLFDLKSGIIRSEKIEGRFGWETDEFSIGVNCGNSQMFDPFANVCRDIMCMPGYKLGGENCLHANESMLQNDACTAIQFTREEYRILNETSILILSSNKTYHTVTFVGDIAHVCILKQESFQSLLRNDPIEGWLSLVSGIISIVCLFMTILVYLIPKLQNQPGKILLCLSISLCLAQLIFLLAHNAETNNMLCKALSILDHFLFLASFLWMNVMSFDVFKTFSSSFSNAEQNKKRFVWYSLYAWLTSLVVISIGVSMDEMTSWSYRPKYGDGACWITNNKGLIIFLLVPGAVLKLFNSIFFVLSVRSICVSKQESSKTLQTKNNCGILIYIKLSTVMGLTWVFGYVATLLKSNVVWYLFIIFNGLQGLFIFCSFVLNKKVYRAIQQCFGIQTQKANKAVKNIAENRK